MASPSAFLNVLPTSQEDAAVSSDLYCYQSQPLTSHESCSEDALIPAHESDWLPPLTAGQVEILRRLDAGESLVGGTRIVRVADELALLLAMGLVQACKRGRYTVNALGRKYFGSHASE